ncbi:MAG: SLBB domain-containing protein [Limnohabitans sp.]
MLKTFTPQVRNATQVLTFAALVGMTLQAQAQFLPAAANAAPTANVNLGANSSAAAGIATSGLPTAGALPAMGMAQAPMMAPRPDLGAQDIQRTTPAAPRQPKPAMPSQFQRFVQESTGKLLPHFGAPLFENPQAYAADAAAPAPGEYVLGPGDEVRIQIWGAVDYAGNQTLDRNGQISLPKIGAIGLHGVQVKDLETVLRKQVGTVFTNVTVNASLGKLRGITVYVVGQAQQPGTYNLNSLSTLVNAVFASGGPSANGSMRSIELKRNGKTVTTLDLYDFIGKGDKSKDAALQPGDVIMIPPAGPRMALTGATDHSAIYELKPGTTVQDILALGGGVPALASTHKALVESIGTDLKAPRQVQDIALDAQGLGRPLKDGDVVTLLAISPAFGNAVTLQGTVAQPLRHKWHTGMRVSDLIPDRDALLTPDYYKRKNQLVQAVDPSKELKDGKELKDSKELKDTKAAGSEVASRVKGQVDQINWDYAVVERLNKAELRTDLIPFNLGKAVLQKDPAHNIELQPGDVLTVMSSTDLRLPTERQTRLVRIEGEVAAPGIHQVLPGETLPQLIARVGGLTAQAYVFGTEFTRESVRKQQQQNLDQIIRRLEAQSQSANATLTANLTAERAAQATALQQQQQAQQRAQIDKLKALRSQGRVSLELDPDKTGASAPRTDNTASALQAALQQLPNVPLEDGDAILVPPQPAFVAVAGSVNNENVLIYKSGRTVGDVIKAAGLAEDAEASEAFVLRADGSVLSRRSQGWFSTFDGTKVMPGDTLIVPAKVDRESTYNFIVRGLRDWTQIFSNLGIGAAAIKTLRN